MDSRAIDNVSAMAAEALPQIVELPLIPAIFAPLQNYLAQFRNSVTGEIATLKTELSDAKASISHLTAQLQAAQGKIGAAEAMLRNHPKVYATKQAVHAVLQHVSQHLGPSFESGEFDTAAQALLLSGPSESNAEAAVVVSSPRSPLRSVSPSLHQKRMEQQQQQRDRVSRPLGKSQSTGQPGSPVSMTGSHDGRTSSAFSAAGASLTSPQGSGWADDKLRQAVKSEIQQWYEGFGLPDAEARHARQAASFKSDVAKLREELATKVDTGTCVNWFDAARGEMHALRDDDILVKKKVSAMENVMEEALQQHTTRLLHVQEHLSQRVAQVFELLGMAEPPVATAPLAPDVRASGRSTAGSSATPIESGLVTPSLTAAATSATQPTTHVTRSKPPPPETQRRSEAGDEIDTGTQAVLQCAAFVALRQRVLDDIVERVSSSRHAHASDVGIELFAIRNDLRQRPTAQRVVEIIREQVNIPALIARCDAIAKQQQVFERAAVFHDAFNTALKTKADVTLLSNYVSHDAFSQQLAEERAKAAALQEEMKLLMDERQEISHIFREVVAHYRRYGAGGGGGGTGWAGPQQQQQQQQQQQLHLTDADEAAQHLHHILTSAGGTGANAGEKSVRQSPVPSRMSSRRQQQAVVKPITESRSQSQVGGFPAQLSPVPGGTIKGGAVVGAAGAAAAHPHHPSAPIPGTPSAIGSTAAASIGGSTRVGVSVSAPGAPTAKPRAPAVPLTANQEAYARYVSEEQLRAQMESLPPIPYERLAVPSPR